MENGKVEDLVMLISLDSTKVDSCEIDFFSYGIYYDRSCNKKTVAGVLSLKERSDSECAVRGDMSFEVSYAGGDPLLFTFVDSKIEEEPDTVAIKDLEVGKIYNFIASDFKADK